MSSLFLYARSKRISLFDQLLVPLPCHLSLLLVAASYVYKARCCSTASCHLLYNIAYIHYIKRSENCGKWMEISHCTGIVSKISFSRNLMMIINMYVAQYTTIPDLRLAGKLDCCQSSGISMMEKDAASEMYARCFLKWYDKMPTVNSDVITPLSKLCAFSLIQCVFAASQPAIFALNY